MTLKSLNGPELEYLNMHSAIPALNERNMTITAVIISISIVCISNI